MTDITLDFDNEEFAKALSHASHIYRTAQEKYRKFGEVALVNVDNIWNLVVWSRFVISFQQIQSMTVKGLPEKNFIVFSSASTDGIHYTSRPAAIAKMARKANNWRYKEDGNRPCRLDNFEPRIFLEDDTKSAWHSVLGYRDYAETSNGRWAAVNGAAFRRMVNKVYKNRNSKGLTTIFHIGCENGHAYTWEDGNKKNSVTINGSPALNFGMPVNGKFLKTFIPSGKTVMFAVVRSDGAGKMRTNDNMFLMVGSDGGYCMFPGMILTDGNKKDNYPCLGETFRDGTVKEAVNTFFQSLNGARGKTGKAAKRDKANNIHKEAEKEVTSRKSGWSVTTIPALISVKHIPALNGLRVRPIWDEKHHKVGYVGRKAGKVVLVWRDWYVKRTTEKARATLLKREKVSA